MGFIIGFMAGSIAVNFMFRVVWFVLSVLAYWRIFQKAGQPGWKSIIPYYHTYVDFLISWKGIFGLIYVVADVLNTVLSASGGDEGPSGVAAALAGLCGIVTLVLHIVESYKLSRSFGRGIGFCIGLIIFEPIFKLILGFGASQYIGPGGELGAEQAFS